MVMVIVAIVLKTNLDRRAVQGRSFSFSVYCWEILVLFAVKT